MTTPGDDAQVGAVGVSMRTDDEQLAVDVVVVGGGVAGLSVLLALPAEVRAALVTKAVLGESNTRYAQGGLAAAVGADDDPELHLRDTLRAGAGLVNEDAARILVYEGPQATADLIRQGAQFDERPGSHEPDEPLAQRYALGREAAHSRWRVLHARGDATGAEIERALVAAVRARPYTLVLENILALDLFKDQDRCSGVDVLCRGACVRIHARLGVVLASGGAGQLWQRTSNPAGATADGVAMAWRAGATLADLEFVQFHPTVLVPPTPGGDAFLVSEAVRGEGAYLRNAQGERYMPAYHADAELAPRDVVARATHEEMVRTGAASAFLDLRHLEAATVRARFPSIGAECARYGLDLACDLIPVAPAAHFCMGGVAVDMHGRTSVPALYAVGEVSCTGVHGANRLASNSLLEGLVFGRRTAQAIAETAGGHMGQWPAATLGGERLSAEVVLPHVVVGDGAGPLRWELRRTMWEHVALRREAAGLEQAMERLKQLARSQPADPETANMLVAAQLVASAALGRRESRGAHFRADYPAIDARLEGRHSLLTARARDIVDFARVGGASDAALPKWEN
jgi:L-aspartate oxidase